MQQLVDENILDQNQIDEYPKKANQIYCDVHPKMQYAFLSTDSNQKNILKCIYCLTEEQLSVQHLIPLQLLQDSNKQTVFNNWPLKNENSIFEQIKEFAKEDNHVPQLKDEIYQFCKQFRMQVVQSIDELENLLLKNADQIQNNIQQIISQYNNLSEKEQTKALLTINKEDFNQKMDILSNIIKKVNQVREQNKSSFLSSIEQINDTKKQISFPVLEAIKQNVLSEVNSYNNRLKIQYKVQPYYENVNNLVQILNNKFNMCNQGYINNVKQYLLSIQDQINQIDFGLIYEVNVHEQIFTSIDNRDFLKVKDYLISLQASKSSKKIGINKYY